MNVLILGKGYIGFGLHNLFHNNREDVNTFFIQKRPDNNSDGCIIQYDDEEILYEYCLEHEINTLINCSGYTGSPNVDGCEDNKEECFEANVKLPVMIERVCKSLDIDFIHMSSGCIYDGYDKVYTEEDTPDFGIFDSHSSFYSKTKHMAEMMLDKDFTCIVRLRMPMDRYYAKSSSKNIIKKLLNYDNIVDFANSKTDRERLSEFVDTIRLNFKAGIYNAVHSNALTTREVVKILKEYDLVNENWKFVPYESLPLKCNRSNCVLSNEKAKEDFDFDWGDEEHYLRVNASLMQKEKQWQTEK